MKIVYFFDIEPFTIRKVDLSYKNYLHGGGFSGTEGPMIESANYMANRGHEVLFTGCSDEPDECKGNLKYSFELKEDMLKEADVFIPFFIILQNPPPWEETTELYGGKYSYVWDYMSRMKKGAKVIIWVQVHLRADLLMMLRDFCENHGLELILIHVSNYIKNFQDFKFASIEDKSGLDIKNVVIKNSINKEIFDKPVAFSPDEKFGNYPFFAHYTRGYEIFKEVCEEMDGNMLQYNYCTENSVGKSEVKKIYDKSDYFVYPLIHKDGIVHHDTYACVIHEAMACGAIVITWDVACMRDVYGENIILMQPPEFSGYDSKAQSGYNELMLEQCKERVVCNIKYLNEHKDQKEAIRKKARAWALNNTYDQELPKFSSLLEQS